MNPDVKRLTTVYVHKVHKSDTLPKIILKYGIDATTLRRANRIWANDSISFRDELYLPVDACSVTAQEMVDDTVFIDGIGAVTIKKVPSSSLSYFPPSTVPSRPKVVEEEARTSRDSFEVLRDTTGRALSTAYNGTTNLIRRMRERKQSASGIDLIEF